MTNSGRERQSELSDLRGRSGKDRSFIFTNLIGLRWEGGPDSKLDSYNVNKGWGCIKIRSCGLKWKTKSGN